MACQGFESSSRNKRKVQVLHLEETNGLDTVQGTDKCGTTHPCGSATEAIQRSLSFSRRNLQERFQQRSLRWCRDRGKKPPEPLRGMFTRTGNQSLQHTDSWE